MRSLRKQFGQAVQSALPAVRMPVSRIAASELFVAYGQFGPLNVRLFVTLNQISLDVPVSETTPSRLPRGGIEAFPQ
jgi:hypothetical protein